MIGLPLELRARESQAQMPAAWFISSGSPGVWIEEICELGVATPGTRVYVLPRSVQDRRAGGALVVAEEARAAPASPRAHAYVKVAGRLHMPADAQLYPPISEKELAECLLWGVQVLHPTIGLVGFRQEDGLRVEDLLRGPERRESKWDGAVTGVAINRRLVSVEPDEPPVAREVIDELRDDIGEDAEEKFRPDQEGSGTGKLGRLLGDAGMKAMEWLRGKQDQPRKTGSSAAGAGMGGKVRGWVDKQMTRLSEALREARYKSVAHLIKMLDSDPDKGLRYALPLTAPGERGRSRPGAGLRARDVDFNLGNLRGGEPSDWWEVPWQMFHKLQEQYRAAANRELRLGRYRRAAYIFAHLLGDYDSAANALRQGRHYREAAVLYRDHLKKPGAAAECLEQGGLLLEAVGLYKELGQFEKAGDLYLRIERPVEAEDAYWKTVDSLLNREDRPAAARILEVKLHLPDNALSVLRSAWPDSAQAAVCVEGAFGLMGRLGWHAAAGKHLQTLVGETTAAHHVLLLADLLARVAGSYPDMAVRGRMRDAVRVLAGKRLGEASVAEATVLVDAVMRLAPEDRLLSRDGGRFIRRKRQPEIKKPLMQRRGRPVVSLAHAFYLAGDAQWKSVAAEGDHFHALGTRGGELVLARGRFDGVVEKMSSAGPGAEHDDYRLVLLGGADSTLLMYRPGTDWHKLRPGALPPGPGDTAVLSLWEQDSHQWDPVVSGGIAGICCDDRGAVWAVQNDAQSGQRVLRVYGAPRMQLLLTKVMPILVPGSPSAHMAACGGRAVIASGEQVLQFSTSGAILELRLGAEATGLAQWPGQSWRVVLTHGYGASLLWPGELSWSGEGWMETLDRDLVSPMAAFVRGDAVVLVGRDQGRIYRIRGMGAWQRTDFEVGSNEVVGVTATAQAGEFALFTREGLVQVLRESH